jgi:signal transduction histidine kinase
MQPLGSDQGTAMAPPPTSPENHHHAALSDETMHALRTPLTIVRAQAQMLERWVRRTQPPEADTLLARLAVIDAMIVKLVLELDVLRESSGDDG